MRLTSTLFSNAISFAKSNPWMAAELQKRDADNNVYFKSLSCQMQTYSQEPDRFYIRVIFDYCFFNSNTRQNPDLFIDLTTLADGSFRVLPPPAVSHGEDVKFSL